MNICNFKYFVGVAVLFVVMMVLVSVAQVFSSEVPHGSIGAWTPGSYGNYPGINNQRSSLPIWVQIVFDRTTTDEFVVNYCSFLRQSNRFINIHGVPKKHGRTKNYVIVVDPSVTQEQLKIELEKANRRFDPEIERLEKLKIEQVKQVTIAIEEARKASIVETERKKEEAEAIRFKNEARWLKTISELDPTKQALLKNAILLDSANNIKIALKAGANIDYGLDGQPPLLWAILLQKFSAAHELLKNKANPNVVYSGKSLIHYLIEQGNLDFACVLVNYGADRAEYAKALSDHLETKLYRAIINDSVGDIRQAIELGANINHASQYNAPLVEAVLSQKHNALEELLKQHADTTIVYSGYNLVHNALNQYDRLLNQFDMRSAILLVKAGAPFSENDTKVYGDMTLMEKIFVSHPQTPAAVNLCIEFLQELINHGYNLNSNDFRANALYQTLNHSFHSGGMTKDFLEFFIMNGANPNQSLIVDRQGVLTPLFKAIAIGVNSKTAAAVIKVLLDAGADINQKASPTDYYIPGFDGITPITPLFFAIKWWQRIDANNNEVVNLLIEHGANL